MEPLDSRPSAVLPPPVPRPAASDIDKKMPSELEEQQQPTNSSTPRRLRMYPWRVLAASAIATTFGLSGWQVQRAIDDRPRSDAITWLSIVVGIVAGLAVLTWTWVTTENARRLVSPAATQELPSPKRAVSTWILPFAFVATAALVVTYLSRRPEAHSGDTTSSMPLAIAVLSLLLAIPLTYRPVHYMAGIVRQVGGYSAKLAQWMWVPVVLAMVGVASIALLRLGGAVDGAREEWAPLWVIAVVAIAPCIVVILLAWRAADSVEEAIGFAFARRGGAREFDSKSVSVSKTSGPTAARVQSTVDIRRKVRQLPGVNLLRLTAVALLAGLALLSLVGAVVMFLFWQESNDAVLLQSQIDRAWDAIAALHRAERVMALAVVGLISLWTFVAVLNVRMASGRRRNPLIAALAWPAAGVGIWMIADALIVDQPTESVIAGLVAQSFVLYIPFFLLERSAEAVGARRTPVRIAYVLGVVLLVYIQGLGGLSNISDSADDLDYGRLAGYLALGALVQLLSTLAVTDATRAISEAAAREAEHHNLLAEQHSNAGQNVSAAQNVDAVQNVTAAPNVNVAENVSVAPNVDAAQDPETEASPPVVGVPAAVPSPDPNTSPAAGA